MNFVSSLAGSTEKDQFLIAWLRTQMKRIQLIYGDKIMAESEKYAKLNELYAK